MTIFSRVIGKVSRPKTGINSFPLEETPTQVYSYYNPPRVEQLFVSAGVENTAEDY